MPVFRLADDDIWLFDLTTDELTAFLADIPGVVAAHEPGVRFHHQLPITVLVQFDQDFDAPYQAQGVRYSNQVALRAPRRGQGARLTTHTRATTDSYLRRGADEIIVELVRDTRRQGYGHFDPMADDALFENLANLVRDPWLLGEYLNLHRGDLTVTFSNPNGDPVGAPGAVTLRFAVADSPILLLQTNLPAQVDCAPIGPNGNCVKLTGTYAESAGGEIVYTINTIGRIPYCVDAAPETAAR